MNQAQRYFYIFIIIQQMIINPKSRILCYNEKVIKGCGNQTLRGNIVRDDAGDNRRKRKNPWCIKHFLLYESTLRETNRRHKEVFFRWSS